MQTAFTVSALAIHISPSLGRCERSAFYRLTIKKARHSAGLFHPNLDTYQSSEMLLSLMTLDKTADSCCIFLVTSSGVDAQGMKS